MQARRGGLLFAMVALVDAAQDVKVALVVPLSGRWPRQGQLKKLGGEMAVEEINATEVSERLQVPWLTLSFADTITERGFKYVFQVSPPSSRLAEHGLDLAIAMAKTNGVEIKKVAPIAQKLRAVQPDLLINGATNFPDIVQMLQKNKEFGVRVPAIGVGGLFTSPEFVDVVGQDLLYGFMATAASHPLKGQEELVRRFRERTKERFMVQDSVSTYADMWIIKEALERAASDDPKKVRDALSAIDLTSGPAVQTLLPNRIRFDPTGRRIDSSPVIVQWQGAEAFTVFPSHVATRKAVWPGK